VAAARGDLPFMISGDSPDVWARQSEFRFDATIGVPPERSETGEDQSSSGVWKPQRWGWVIDAESCATLCFYDGYASILVGLY
jgi:hypothetical protein